MKEKLFVIKKYVKARNARSAIKLEKNIEVDDCWVDEEWRKNGTDKLAEAVGFNDKK